MAKQTKTAGDVPAGALYALLDVAQEDGVQGEILIRLFPDKTPVTVQNFLGLAKGEQEFLDPSTGQKTKRPFYDGLIFHRVIPEFMIQGGCPQGSGRGGPGYRFNDEIVEGLVFDKTGLLAMANSGPGTNGSQFFITVAPAPWLNGRHTIFGEVTRGMELVNLIANVPRDSQDKPLSPVRMKKVTFIDKRTE
ncbi:MAG TPA: peptidylprolyl isomerase [bacterium]|nr:peptidylprolyl isomerase [bacterium]